MQRATRARAGAGAGIARTETGLPTRAVDCPVCGEPVRGIAAARPGEHRFVGCGHYASARFLSTRSGTATPAADRPSLGP